METIREFYYIVTHEQTGKSWISSKTYTDRRAFWESDEFGEALDAIPDGAFTVDCVR